MAIGAVALGLAGCVTQEKTFSLACPIGGDDVFVRTTVCDGEYRICMDRPYAHQNVWILNRSSSAAAININWSDGTSERVVMQGNSSLNYEKPVGTGVRVTAQC